MKMIRVAMKMGWVATKMVRMDLDECGVEVEGGRAKL
jgi:hypothetical protein